MKYFISALALGAMIQLTGQAHATESTEKYTLEAVQAMSEVEVIKLAQTIPDAEIRRLAGENRKRVTEAFSSEAFRNERLLVEIESQRKAIERCYRAIEEKRLRDKDNILFYVRSSLIDVRIEPREQALDVDFDINEYRDYSNNLQKHIYACGRKYRAMLRENGLK